jgi:hypothetical protein
MARRFFGISRDCGVKALGLRNIPLHDTLRFYNLTIRRNTGRRSNDADDSWLFDDPDWRLAHRPPEEILENARVLNEFTECDEPQPDAHDPHDGSDLLVVARLVNWRYEVIEEALALLDIAPEHEFQPCQGTLVAIAKPVNPEKRPREQHEDVKFREPIDVGEWRDGVKQNEENMQ